MHCKQAQGLPQRSVVSRGNAVVGSNGSNSSQSDTDRNHCSDRQAGVRSSSRRCRGCWHFGWGCWGCWLSWGCLSESLAGDQAHDSDCGENFFHSIFLFIKNMSSSNITCPLFYYSNVLIAYKRVCAPCFYLTLCPDDSNVYCEKGRLLNRNLLFLSQKCYGGSVSPRWLANRPRFPSLFQR